MKFPYHCYHGNRPVHVVKVLYILPHNHQVAVVEGVRPDQLHWLIQKEHTGLGSAMAGRELCRFSCTAHRRLPTRCRVGATSSMLWLPPIPYRVVSMETVASCATKGRKGRQQLARHAAGHCGAVSAKVQVLSYVASLVNHSRIHRTSGWLTASNNASLDNTAIMSCKLFVWYKCMWL